MTIRVGFSMRRTSAVQVALSLLVLTAGSMVAGQETPPPATLAMPSKLTLQQAVQTGLEQNPSVIGQRASRNYAISRKESADSFLSALTGPQIHTRRRQASLGVAIQQSGLDQAELETINAVTRAYLTVLYATEQQKLAEEAGDRFRAIHKLAEEMLKKGGSRELTSSDVDRIGTYRLLAETKHAEASSGIARAKALLREAMGLAHDCPIEIADERMSHQPIKIDCTCAVNVALNHRPELIQALLFAEVVCLEVKAQRLDPHAYARTFAAISDIHAKILPAGAINGDYRPGPLGPEMPTHLAGSLQARAEQVQNLYERAAAVAHKARGLIALEVEDTCLRLTEQATQVGLLQQASEKATKLARDAEKAFRADQLSAEKMLTAQVIEAETRARLNEAVFKHGSALANLHRVTGGHFWDCVEKAPAPQAGD